MSRLPAQANRLSVWFQKLPHWFGLETVTKLGDLGVKILAIGVALVAFDFFTLKPDVEWSVGFRSETDQAILAELTNQAEAQQLSDLAAFSKVTQPFLYPDPSPDYFGDAAFSPPAVGEVPLLQPGALIAGAQVSGLSDLLRDAHGSSQVRDTDSIASLFEAQPAEAAVWGEWFSVDVTDPQGAAFLPAEWQTLLLESDPPSSDEMAAATFQVVEIRIRNNGKALANNVRMNQLVGTPLKRTDSAGNSFPLAAGREVFVYLRTETGSRLDDLGIPTDDLRSAFQVLAVDDRTLIESWVPRVFISLALVLVLLALVVDVSRVIMPAPRPRGNRSDEAPPVGTGPTSGS